MAATRAFAVLGSITMIALGTPAGVASAASTGVAEPDPSADIYAVPQARPAGMVGVLSFGVESLTIAPRVSRDYLHVRIAVQNDEGSAPWTLVAGEQQMRGGSASLPLAFADSSDGRPFVTVAKGERGWIDLFFAVDRNVAPRRLDLQWTVDLGSLTERHETMLDREQQATSVYYGPEPSRDARFVAAGPTWWYQDEPWTAAPADAFSVEHLQPVREHHRVYHLPPVLIRVDLRNEQKGGVS
jgi:hypothetical protein